jgi:hypothetical protein
MTRRSLLLAIAILGLLVCGSLATVALLVHHEPDHYRKAAVAPGPERVRKSQKFFDSCSAFISDLTSGEPTWDGQFTDEQINSFFEEEFVRHNLDAQLLPEGFSQPRIVFEPGKVRLAFRYGSGAWSTIVSIDLVVWLAKGEPNVIVMELNGLRAGALPIATQSLLDRLFEVARKNGFDVLWYRYNGHPTALLRFQSSQPRTTLQLQALQIDQGSIRIRGKTLGPGPVRALLPPGMPWAAGAD